MKESSRAQRLLSSQQAVKSALAPKEPEEVREVVGYTTHHEILFIKDLGSHAPQMSYKPTRRVLLERYVSAMRNRPHMSNINREDCIEFAMKELRRC